MLWNIDHGIKYMQYFTHDCCGSTLNYAEVVSNNSVACCSRLLDVQ